MELLDHFRLTNTKTAKKLFLLGTSPKLTQNQAELRKSETIREHLKKILIIICGHYNKREVCKLSEIIKNPKVDEFLNKEKRWKEELTALRMIVLDCGLSEEIKWGQPCYTLDGKNVIIIHGFKDYCALLFIKGALLKDLKGILIQQTENVQDARQIRFTNIKEIQDIKDTLSAYVIEAMEAEKSGLQIEHKKMEEYKIPEELQIKFNDFNSKLLDENIRHFAKLNQNKNKICAKIFRCWIFAIR